jgi:Phage integrase family
VIRLHDLRHTHAALMLRHGIPLKVVSERLGHSTPAFTIDIYQHVLPVGDATPRNPFARLIILADLTAPDHRGSGTVATRDANGPLVAGAGCEPVTFGFLTVR